MTSPRRRRSKNENFDPRESIEAARDAAREVAAQGGDVEIDPASELFFEFAAPLLLEARDENEFEIAAMLAEFIWSASHFSAAEQVIMLDEFIRETGVPEEMIPWLLDVYSVLASRKEALVG